MPKLLTEIVWRLLLLAIPLIPSGGVGFKWGSAPQEHESCFILMVVLRDGSSICCLTTELKLAFFFWQCADKNPLILPIRDWEWWDGKGRRMGLQGVSATVVL